MSKRLTQIPFIIPLARMGLIILTFLIIWILLNAFERTRDVFPSPLAIVNEIWTQKKLYLVHFRGSMPRVAQGFLYGNVIAIIFSILTYRFRIAEILMHDVLITFYAAPIIVFLPIIGLVLDMETAAIILSTVCVYFPTYSYLNTALKHVDRGYVDVVRSAGGTAYHTLLKIRLRTALPAIFSGLSTSVPSAFLGVLLAEYLLGGEYGIGSLLKATVPQALSVRIWGISIITTLISIVFMSLFLFVSSVLSRNTSIVTSIFPLSNENEISSNFSRCFCWRLLKGLISFGVVILLWHILVKCSGIDPIIGKTPLDVFKYVVLDPEVSSKLSSVYNALGKTLALIFVGTFIGLSFAYVSASIVKYIPMVGQTILPFAMITQTIPLMVFVPLIVLIFGRGIVAILGVTVSVTFFPSFIAAYTGFNLVPQEYRGVVKVLGMSSILEFIKIDIPASFPYLITALKLAVPKVLTGVIIAESIATGTGIGGIVSYEAKGKLDFALMWTIAIVVTIVSVVLYKLIVWVEQWTKYKLGR